MLCTKQGAGPNIMLNKTIVMHRNRDLLFYFPVNLEDFPSRHVMSVVTFLACHLLKFVTILITEYMSGV